jgi:hypothetical protein
VKLLAPLQLQLLINSPQFHPLVLHQRHLNHPLALQQLHHLHFVLASGIVQQFQAHRRLLLRHLTQDLLPPLHLQFSHRRPPLLVQNLHHHLLHLHLDLLRLHFPRHLHHFPQLLHHFLLIRPFLRLIIGLLKVLPPLLVSLLLHSADQFGNLTELKPQLQGPHFAKFLRLRIFGVMSSRILSILAQRQRVGQPRQVQFIQQLGLVLEQVVLAKPLGQVQPFQSFVFWLREPSYLYFCFPSYP